MTKSVFQIDAPRDRLFGIIADFERWNEWFPGCKEARITADKGTSKQVDLTLASMKTITMGLEFDLTPTELINFRKISGKDVKDYAGSFRLQNSADGAGTVVMGEMEMDAGAMVPKFMVGRIMEKSLRETAEALKTRVRTAPPAPAYEAAAPAAAAIGGGVTVVAPAAVRRKRVMHIIQSRNGFRVWIMGKTYFYNLK
ncbi:MAG: type II toxin-antitoxin system RatA family toxin [Bryobacteraceae bacterium]